MYEAIAVVEFDGRLSPAGESEGHYLCDIKEKVSNMIMPCLVNYQHQLFPIN